MKEKPSEWIENAKKELVFGKPPHQNVYIDARLEAVIRFLDKLHEEGKV
jgi:hypothetical protein